MNQSIKSTIVLVCALSLGACDRSQQQLTDYLQQGKDYYQSGDIKNAQVAFNKALAMSPDDITNLYKIADALSAIGDLNSAAQQYQAILKKDDKQIPARLKLGQLLLQADKPDIAQQLAQQILAIDADNSEARVLLGKAYASQNNTDAAFVEAQTALQKKPDDINATVLLAALMIKSGEYDQAQRTLNQAIEKFPKTIAPRLLLSELQMNSHLSKEAEQTLQAIIQLEPNEFEHRKRLAVFLMTDKRLDDAEKVLRLAVNELPENDQAELVLVNFLATQRQPEVAIAELIPMIEHHPKQWTLRFKLADLQMTIRQTDKVEETLKELLALKPSDEVTKNAEGSLARLYLATNRMHDAKVLMKPLLAKYPEDADILLLQGEINLADRQANDAIALFRKVIALQPQNIKALKLLSNAHSMTHDWVLAKENREKIVALLPKDESARVEFANMLLQAGDTQAGLQQLAALFKLNPDSKPGLEVLFKVYVQQKQWDKAQQVAQQFQLTDKEGVTGYFLSGLAYQAEGKLDKSIGRYLQVLDKQPLAVEALTQLVKDYLSLKQADKAIAKLNDLLKQHPENFVAYSLLGGVYSEANKWPEAIKAYQKALAIKPDWLGLYRNLAMVYHVQNNDAEAIKVLQDGLVKVGEQPELVGDLAALYQKRGENSKLSALYESVYQHQPDSLLAANNLARYLADYGQDKADLERAASLAQPLEQGSDLLGLDTVAWIAFKKRDIAKAERILLKINQLNPADPVINYHLGMLYFQKGDKEQARKYLQKAVSTKAEFSGWSEAMKTLKAVNGN